MLILLKKNVMRKLLKPAYKLFVPTAAKQKVVTHFNEFYDGLSRMKYNNYLIGFTLTIAVWIITFLGVYFLALSLHISVSLIFIISMAPIASFLSVLPISVGGLGTREAVYVFFLSSLSIESEYAVALSLMVFIFLNLFYVPIGIVTYLLSKEE
ncbi:MAG: flippase-like domain-containing protein, partial [Candidatus Heimdallarchaeota archaeon]